MASNLSRMTLRERDTAIADIHVLATGRPRVNNLPIADSNEPSHVRVPLELRISGISSITLSTLRFKSFSFL